MAEKYLRLRRGPWSGMPTLNRGEIGLVLDRKRIAFSTDGVSNRVLGEFMPYEAGMVYIAGDVILRSKKFYSVDTGFTASTWGTDSVNVSAITPTDSVVVANIAARNAITGLDLFSGLHAYVLDATGDVTVTSGAALYIYANSTWNKIAEYESLDITVNAATESLAGTAEIATQVETDTGTDDARFVTPLKLATWSKAPTTNQKAALAGTGTPNATNKYVTSDTVASDTTQGIIELATQAEVNTGTDAARAVTPATLSSWTKSAFIPTTDQKDALAGEGTPSTSNKFITKSYLDGVAYKRNVAAITRTNTATVNVTTAMEAIYVAYSATGTVTVNMPAISTCTDGQIFLIKDTGTAGTNNITLVPNGSDTIDESAGQESQNRYKLDSDKQSVWFQADTTANRWQFVS